MRGQGLFGSFENVIKEFGGQFRVTSMRSLLTAGFDLVADRGPPISDLSKMGWCNFGYTCQKTEFEGVKILVNILKIAKIGHFGLGRDPPRMPLI